MSSVCMRCLHEGVHSKGGGTASMEACDGEKRVWGKFEP